jgi:hypothetical protein
VAVTLLFFPDFPDFPPDFDDFPSDFDDFPSDFDDFPSDLEELPPFPNFLSFSVAAGTKSGPTTEYWTAD